MSESDNILATEAQRGDRESFAQLYDAYARRIFAFIYQKVQQREVAEDLTSQTFFKALEKIDTFDSEKGNFVGWIYQIARNTVIDHFRSRKETEDIEDMWDLDTGENLVDKVDAKMQLDEVREFLHTLSADQREVILLRIWEELPFREIAEIIGKSEANCKMIFGRGISKVREVFAFFILLLALLFLGL